MKQLFTLFFVALLPVGVAMAAQEWKVSTETQKKKILLEEYTGLNCGWCPEGHQMANVLLDALPGQSFVVNVHAGSYAEPSGNQADYRTDEGISLAEWFNTASYGYPCGSVNRYLLSGEQYLSSRSLWTEIATEIHKQDAPVNLYVESLYDGDTGKLSVHVEGYFTEQESAAQMHELSVLWTQDDIVGYQNGGNAGDEYVHQHMLRGYISDTWGDDIVMSADEGYFSKDYEIELPDSVRKIPVKPEDINVIAFVTTDCVDILNVEGGKPTYINYNMTEQGELQSPEMAIGTRYGFDFFDFYLKNKSGKAINSATFLVSVGSEETTVTVDCDIEAFRTAAVRVPATMQYAAKGKTKYSVKLTQMNGIDVEPSQLSGGFQQPVVTGEPVSVKIQTDQCASQDVFSLKNSNGDIVKEFGPFDDGVTNMLEEELTGLEDGETYCIEILDKWGDGLYEGDKGSLVVHASTGKLIDQFYSISGYGVRSFFTIDHTLGIKEVEQQGDEAETVYYTADGRRVATPEKSGLYIAVSAGNKANKKVIIK